MQAQTTHQSGSPLAPDSPKPSAKPLAASTPDKTDSAPPPTIEKPRDKRADTLTKRSISLESLTARRRLDHEDFDPFEDAREAYYKSLQAEQAEREAARQRWLLNQVKGVKWEKRLDLSDTSDERTPESSPLKEL